MNERNSEVEKNKSMMIRFGTAWQTNYTGDEWHFAKDAAFSPSDLDRGIVKNVTPLYAAPGRGERAE